MRVGPVVVELLAPVLVARVAVAPRPHRVVDPLPGGDRQAAAGLAAVARTDDVALRGDTADLLGRLAHPAARAALEELRHDPDPDVAEIAAEALEGEA